MSQPKEMSLAQYKKGSQHTFHLPSGLKVTIRKIPPTVLFSLFKNVPTNKSAKEIADTPALREQFPRLVKEMLPACFVSPKIVTGQTSKDGELSIDDVYPDDVFVAIDTIFKHSGLTAEEMEKRKSFRK